jgi:FkbM family methyltransferase
MVELPTYRKEEELERSTALLQERLGEAKHHFAYPYGRYDPATRDLLNRASWVLSAVTTDRGWNYRDADSFALRRDMLETKWTAAKARVWLWRGALVGGVFEQNLPFPPASRRQDADGTLRQAESFHSRQSSLLESLAGQTRLRTLNPHLREVLRSFFYEILWWQSGRKCLVNSLPGGELVRVHPRYRYASCNLEEYYAFRRAVRPGDVALDVGANVGFYTVLLSQWVGINGRVAAFEPMPTVFHALRRHVVMNANAGPVQCFPMAVSDQCGRQSLLAAPHVGINRLAAPHEAKSAEPQCEVETISLDVFCQQHELKPNFIKIDVEGYELWVLRGARETIRQAGSQLQLFVELHPSVWPALGLSRKDIEDELAEQHLRLEPLTQQHDPWVLEGICSRLVPIGTSCGS